jgi:hypothetical protein
MMRTTWISIAASATVCIMLSTMLLLAVTHHTTRPRTYRDAVIQLLDERGIRYEEVRVTNACTFDPRDCAFLSSYTAYVNVIADEPVHGRIVCERQNDDGDRDACLLTLPTLELHNILLPPLAHDPSWLSIPKAQLDHIATWLRTWIPRR